MSEREVAPAEGDRYHGWVNRPTWIVHQWISAEAESAAIARATLQNAGDMLRGAEELKAWIEAGNPLTEEGTLYSDLLGWALSTVAWVDVAGALAPEAEPDEPPDADGPLAVHPSPSGN